jgi:hypothetical protein
MPPKECVGCNGRSECNKSSITSTTSSFQKRIMQCQLPGAGCFTVCLATGGCKVALTTEAAVAKNISSLVPTLNSLPALLVELNPPTTGSKVNMPSSLHTQHPARCSCSGHQHTLLQCRLNASNIARTSCHLHLLYLSVLEKERYSRALTLWNNMLCSVHL